VAIPTRFLLVTHIYLNKHTNSSANQQNRVIVFSKRIRYKSTAPYTRNSPAIRPGFRVPVWWDTVRHLLPS
jgi:hypothetical protein